MNLKFQLFILSLVFVMAFLALSNPSEETYLSRVSNDYQQYHVNTEIPLEVLQHIGRSNRSTYLLFSTYNYQFGNLKVFYFGIANNIYYVGIQKQKKEENPIKMV